MEKKETNWFLRLTKWSWTPVILGALVCLGVIAIANEVTGEAACAGVGLIAFGWIAMIKGFMK